MLNALTPLANQYILDGKAPEGLIVDSHGHWGAIPGAYLPAAPEEVMIRDLKQANVAKIVCSDMLGLFLNPDEGNLRLAEAIERHPELLCGYWAVDARFKKSMETAARDLQRHRGFVGFKLLPDYHTTPLEEDNYRPVLEDANDLSLPILIHTWGGSAFNDPSHVERVASQYPKAIFIMGHSGYGHFEHSICLAREMPNVYLELTAVYVAHDFSVLPSGSGTPQALDSCLFTAGIIERMVERAGSEKILFGTDMPWYNPNYAAGAVLFADISEQDQRNILGENARRLFHF